MLTVVFWVVKLHDFYFLLCKFLFNNQKNDVSYNQEKKLSFILL